MGWPATIPGCSAGCTTTEAASGETKAFTWKCRGLPTPGWKESGPPSSAGPLANVTFTGFAHLLQAIGHGLRKIQ